MPSVSVIIPTFNRASMLKEAIQSVLNQTYTDYEIIVIDDGSTDNTSEIVRDFVTDKIRYFCLENHGRSYARNYAIRMARGDYIAFLDSDDLFLPHRIEVQVNCLENNPEVGMVYSDSVVFDEHGKKCFYYEATASGWIYKHVAFFLPLVIIMSTVMVRSGVLAQIGGFDESMERFEDTDMWRRIAKRYPILGLRQPLSKIRAHSDNAMQSQDPKKILEQITYYVSKIFSEDHDLNYIFLKRGAGRLYFHYGFEVLKYPRWQSLGRKFLIYSIKYWPFSLSTYVYLVDSYLDRSIYRIISWVKGKVRLRID